MGDRDDSPGPLRYRLWAGGLYKDITEDEVCRKMERYGEVVDVRIRSSARDTFAFVQFTCQKAIDTAIEKMDNSTSLGDRVRVAQATENARKRGDEDGPRRDPRRGDSRGPRRGGDVQDRRGDSRDRRGDVRGGRGGRAEEGRCRRGDQRGDCDRRDDRCYSRRGSCGDDRDDSREYRRGGGRYERREPRDAYSPPSRGRHDGRDGRYRRSRSRDGVVRMAGKVPVGRHKITIANLPEDMSWLELKDLGRDYGPSLTFARTYRKGSSYYGMLEFKDRMDADRVISEMNNRRVQGSKERLQAYYGPGPGGE
uniref:RRM domain-containing protein n=1 Tax=Alexandrium monilatum TaxID=311494 RepID=A0A7S4Q4I6_9DINO|mmetsp:Transcript_54654/g.170955  ORF Transcript_54654/g.170955 Transcript_54654/m.170955 type:complete len:310 (-) Transcript_54654:61-990(-)